MKKSFLLIISLLFSPLLIPVIAVSYVDVSISEAKSMIEFNPSLFILDVRNQSEYDEGHIRNAKLIPVYELSDRLDELDKNKHFLVYCRSGQRSSTASQVLAENDFLHIFNMLGGIIDWTEAGHTIYTRYASLQEAIDNASEGDAIHVSSGTYQGNIVIDKTINLIGENQQTTIVRANWTIGERGFYIVSRNVHVSGFTIDNGIEGVYLAETAGSCIISDCHIINNDVGIFVKSNNNLFTRNLIANNTRSGIEVYASCICAPVKGNRIVGNSLSNNIHGIMLENAIINLIYQNNFVENTHQTACSVENNTWDNGYPSGGNYWSDYNGTDLYNGSEQNQTGSDGIGDIAYKVCSDSEMDNFPLVAQINVFDVGSWEGSSFDVSIVSNSSVSAFHFAPGTSPFLRFNVTGEDGTLGFSRITIPKNLLWDEDEWEVYLGNETLIPIVVVNNEFTFLYIVYDQSVKTIYIYGSHAIPEFTKLMLIMVLLGITLIFLTDWEHLRDIKLSFRERCNGLG